MKRRRGRPRAYDPETALAQAMSAFWGAGYSATSLDELAAATCMNRPSLYAAFGDKKALYLETLGRYRAAGREAMDKALAYDRKLAEGLRRVYAAALDMYFPEKSEARG
jgi:AcrR family transcriptional regulator